MTISLELFQALAVERLKILKAIEQVLARLNTTLTTAASSKKDEIEKMLRKELKDKLDHLKVSVSVLLVSATRLTSILVHHLPVVYRSNVGGSAARYHFSLHPSTGVLSE